MKLEMNQPGQTYLDQCSKLYPSLPKLVSIVRLWSNVLQIARVIYSNNLSDDFIPRHIKRLLSCLMAFLSHGCLFVWLKSDMCPGDHNLTPLEAKRRSRVNKFVHELLIKFLTKAISPRFVIIVIIVIFTVDFS